MPGSRRGHIRALHLNDPATRHPEVLIMQQRAWTRTIPMHHPFHLMSGFTAAQATAIIVSPHPTMMRKAKNTMGT